MHKLKLFKDFVRARYTTSEFSVDCDTPDVDTTEANSPWANIIVMRQVSQNLI